MFVFRVAESGVPEVVVDKGGGGGAWGQNSPRQPCRVLAVCSVICQRHRGMGDSLAHL